MKTDCFPFEKGSLLAERLTEVFDGNDRTSGLRESIARFTVRPPSLTIGRSLHSFLWLFKKLKININVFTILLGVVNMS